MCDYFRMNILKFILDFIFPQSAFTQNIENSTAEHFFEHASSSLEQVSDTVYSLFQYKDPFVSHSLWELKYRGNIRIAKLFANLLYDHMIEQLADMRLFFDFFDPILIPLPLSKQRFKERGWNQTEMIADALQKKDTNRSFRVRKDILIKIIHTKSQTKLSKSDRLRNLKDCFSVTKPEYVKNRNIILLDDVTTTGSTIKEAADTLLKAGARKIIAFTIAH
jgi:ComF family protein